MHYKLAQDGKSANLHLRIDPRQKELIDQAAYVVGKNRSSFMVDAAYNAAEEILLDQTRFNLNAEQWIKFNEALNALPQPHNLLKNLLATKAPWEK